MHYALNRCLGPVLPRPVGQTLSAGAERPEVGPTRRLDIELELGIFIGVGNDRANRSRSPMRRDA
jgi:hypothetical protein